MYLHLGEDTVIKFSEIVGIFDIENTSIGKATKDFLAKSEKDKNVIYVSYEMPKSFIVTSDKGINKVYISQISAATLKKRATEISKYNNF